MFENAHWSVILAYWLASFIGLGLLQRRYKRYLLRQSEDVQRFAFGRVGMSMEFLSGIALLLIPTGLLIWLIGWARFRESYMLVYPGLLAFGYITTLSRAGARQQWAIEDRQREVRDGKSEQTP